jgi:acyl-coenzyme A thioesterase PaaI-like protein
MKMGWYNKNAIGSHFGGSLYTMTDPFYMIMLLKIMGKDYVVIDMTARIEFVRPAIGPVTAEFVLTDLDIERIREKTATENKFLPKFTIYIKNTRAQTVARVTKTIYVRRKNQIPTN